MIQREELEQLRLEYRRARSRKAKDDVMKRCSALCSDNPQDFAAVLEAMVSDSTEEARCLRYREELAPIGRIVKMNRLVSDYLHKSGGWFTQRLAGTVVGENPVYFRQSDLENIEDAIHKVGKILTDFKFTY